MSRGTNRTGLGEILDAVPWDEIVELATTKAEACNARSEEDLSKCAREAVRSKLCLCVSDEEQLVEAVVGEYLRIREGSGNS